MLECLTAEGEPDDVGAVSVATSVRALAAELGLGRDAVASAVQALAVAGFVMGACCYGWLRPWTAPVG